METAPRFTTTASHMEEKGGGGEFQVRGRSSVWALAGPCSIGCGSGSRSRRRSIRLHLPTRLAHIEAR
eukprot:1626475-Rhodomonas_salina.1